MSSPEDYYSAPGAGLNQPETTQDPTRPPQPLTSATVIGILGLIFGGFGLLAAPLYWMTWDQQVEGIVAMNLPPEMVLWDFVLGLLLSVTLVISSVGLLNLWGWGRVMFLFYAFVSVGAKAVVGVMVLMNANAFLARGPEGGAMIVGAFIGLAIQGAYPFIGGIFMLLPNAAKTFDDWDRYRANKQF